ncbi:MAG: single-stranded-DNA-specific exonuclease RecJ [Patescibacteria group bacterium]
MTDIVNQLLARRGITTEAARERFLRPSYERDLHDPFLFSQMNQAVTRILHALEKNEKITIFADYDADGVPAAVILSEFFKKVGHANFDVYIPDRHEEEFGLKEFAVQKIAATDTKLVITVDCGITDLPGAALLASHAIDLIITDHHLPPEQLPKAVAIIDPKLLGDEYPEKMLCGAGVAFKLVQALIKILSQRTVLKNPNPRTVLGDIAPGWEKWLLDLVAIATVSDMVPLTGENRALVYFGLKVLRQTPRLGLRALARVLKLDPQYLTEDDIAFSIGPRINSASRMTHGREAYELLATTDLARAEALAKHLDLKNRERRDEVQKIIDSVGVMTERALPPVLIFGHEDWSLGVLGLAASKLVEQFSRTVFIWGKNGSGLIKGSCRAAPGVNVVALMGAAGPNIFSNFGGHAASGGFSLVPEKLPKLEAGLLAAYELAPRGEGAVAKEPDLDLLLDEITEDFCANLHQLAPFGLGNPKPLLSFRHAPLMQKKTFGSTHLELQFSREFSRPIKAIKFFAAELAKNDDLVPGAIINLLANLEKSYFRGRPELRLRIVDLTPVR